MPANAHTSKEFTRLCNNASKTFNSMCKHIRLNKCIASGIVEAIHLFVLSDFDQSNLRRGYDGKC